jgi:SSS family solute:Na+ symporter/sodium/pantothenate symporter
MAAKETGTIRRSIYVLASYNTFIYLPLIVICICGRALIPELPAQNSDEIIPRLAMRTTEPIWGGSLIAGLILAAPFGAVMATVSSYLVVIASGLVRDIYQRFIDPDVNAATMRRLSYFVMVAVGLIAVAANLRPVAYLQAIVVFSGSCGAAAFLVPALMAAYWRRATASGALAAMLGGTAAILLLYSVGWVGGGFRPYLLLGIEPLIWGVLTSLVAGVIVSLVTTAPDEGHVARCFDRDDTT